MKHYSATKGEISVNSLCRLSGWAGWWIVRWESVLWLAELSSSLHDNVHPPYWHVVQWNSSSCSEEVLWSMFGRRSLAVNPVSIVLVIYRLKRTPERGILFATGLDLHEKWNDFPLQVTNNHYIKPHFCYVSTWLRPVTPQLSLTRPLNHGVFSPQELQTRSRRQ